MSGDQFFKRGRLDIMFTIQSLCNIIPSKKTHIMYKCNLSFRQLEIYLEFLTNKGCLKPIDEGTYKTTERGRKFTKKYQHVKNLLE